MNVAAIQDELLSLPAVERVKMIDVLWHSLSEPAIQARETGWAAESERRIDAFEAGQLTARDARTVFSDLKKSLPK